jgi:hypothetical protein
MMPVRRDPSLAGDAFELFEADDAIDLAKIDEALDKAKAADSSETALAALASATAGINAYASRQVVALSDKGVEPPEAGSTTAAQAYYMYVRSPLAFGARPGKAPTDRQSNIETRLEKYWTSVQSVVHKFGPTQYQISLGFPLVISVTFTWDVPRS